MTPVRRMLHVRDFTRAIALVTAMSSAAAAAGPGGCEEAARLRAELDGMQDGNARIAALEKAVTLCPDDWRMQNDLGVVYEEAGRLDDAAARYRRARELDDSAPEPLHGLGDLQFKRGECRDAVRSYTEFLLRASKDMSVQAANANIEACRKKIGGSERFRTAEEIEILLGTSGLAYAGKAIHVEPGEVDLGGDLLFDYDSDEVRPPAEEQLREVVSAFSSKRLDATRMIVEGHADERGTPEYNQSLSERRAASVATRLRDLGLTKLELETIGYGESRPKAEAQTEDAYASNRRVVLKVTKP